MIGVDEDEHACAAAAPGVPIGDDERNHILQVVTSSVSPVPDFDVRMIADNDATDRGFILIAVQRTTAAPHAVALQTNLRYPRREGTITRYLREAEVADAYRQRLAGLERIDQRLHKVWADGVARLDVASVPGCASRWRRTCRAR